MRRAASRSTLPATLGLLDHLIGADEDAGGNCEAERSGGL